VEMRMMLRKKRGRIEPTTFSHLFTATKEDENLHEKFIYNNKQK